MDEVFCALRKLGRFYVEYAWLLPAWGVLLRVAVRRTPAAYYCQLCILCQRVTIGYDRAERTFRVPLRVLGPQPVQRHTDWHTERARRAQVAILSTPEVAQRQHLN